MEFLSYLGWVLGLLVLYTYLGYPLGLRLVAGLRQCGRPSGAWDGEGLGVSVLIAAHNEEDSIKGKIRNVLAQDYPSDVMEVLVGLDGCTDTTAQRANEIVDPRLHVIEYEAQEGKQATIRKLSARASHQLLVVTDADVMLEGDAVARMVGWFHDPHVGGVSGTLQLGEPRTAMLQAMSLYLRFEVWQRKLQSQCGTSVVYHGPLYAIRKSLVADSPSPGVAEDMYAAFRTLEAGYVIRYDDQAIAVGKGTSSIGEELRRKWRIATGSYNCYVQCWKLLCPGVGAIAWHIWSYKVLRDLTGVAIPLLVLLTVLLATGSRALGWVVGLHAVAMACTLVGLVVCQLGIRKTIPFTFLAAMAYLGVMTIGHLAGLLLWLYSGDRRGSVWATAR